MIKNLIIKEQEIISKLESQLKARKIFYSIPFYFFRKFFVRSLSTSLICLNLTQFANVIYTSSAITYSDPGLVVDIGVLNFMILLIRLILACF